MVINRYILLTGLLKEYDMLYKTIQDIINLKNKYNICKFVIVTWKGEIEKINNNNLKNILLNNKFIYSIEYPTLRDVGRGNHLAQMYSYKKGYEIIKNMINIVDDIYILRIRSGMYIDRNFYNEIFDYDYKLYNDEILTNKIWIPWCHERKPFYFEDNIFYCHFNDMMKLYNIDKIFKRKKLRRGITHIRKFMTIFLRHEKYEGFCNNILQNKDNIFLYTAASSIDTTFDDICKNVKCKKMLETYYEILNKYFRVYTKRENTLICKFKLYERGSYSNKLLKGITYNNFKKISDKEKEVYIKKGKCEMNLLYSDNDITKRLNYIKNI